MQPIIYGVLNYENVHIDVSNTERGAKQYATKNNYNKVSYRIGSNAFELSEKLSGKWININNNLK